MKNIHQTNRKVQNSEANQTIARINRLRAAFKNIAPGEQEKFIELLTVEIEEITDEAVKFWLIRFRSILEAVKTEATQ